MVSHTLFHSRHEILLLPHLILQLSYPGILILKCVVLESLWYFWAFHYGRVAVGAAETVVQPLVAALLVKDVFTDGHDLNLLLVEKRIEANGAVCVLVENWLVRAFANVNRFGFLNALAHESFERAAF